MTKDPQSEFLCPRRLHRAEGLAEGELIAWAPAKLNLNLLVGPRSADGYHPIDSITAKISLYDQIDFTNTSNIANISCNSLREPGLLELHCPEAICGPSERNLALRAAKLLADRTGGGGATITLHKHIPVAGGLGGGSSDAAAVLLGLNELWRCGLTGEKLAALGSELGADVPLFLAGPASRMTGRGEKLSPVEVHPFVAILLVPQFGCSTAEVYFEFDTEYDHAPRPIGPQLEPQLLSQPPSRWRERLSNDLAAPAQRVAPELADLMARLASAVSVPVHLTGSGSTLFCLCDDRAEADAVLADIPAGLRSACRMVESNPW